MSEKMLLIEDDQSLHPVLRTVAQELGLELLAAATGREGIEIANRERFKLVVLDLTLPDADGTDLCRNLRAALPKIPIIILTGRNDEPSHILGLELGADDYVSKPFSLPELIARIRVVLRRAEVHGAATESDAQPAVIGALRLDPRRREFFLSDAPLELSRTEYEVLEYLFNHPGKAITRDELVEEVWGYNCSGFEGTVTAYLSRIRLKIEKDPDKPQYLTTLRGVGYRFVEPGEIDSSGNLKSKSPPRT